VNTLALSVLERVRELGLLRALGMTRSQLRSMIRWEAVLGAVLG
jgi:putative ABC transport system permease protein